ncbi:hypothetical protein N431DRAFT_489448 [Stipitochalara longipes BDJ]|nr:hypothetical protein N431DRAFT_489448 [Stipitochalara longipes BDJ]
MAEPDDKLQALTENPDTGIIPTGSQEQSSSAHAGYKSNAHSTLLPKKPKPTKSTERGLTLCTAPMQHNKTTESAITNPAQIPGSLNPQNAPSGQTCPSEIRSSTYSLDMSENSSGVVPSNEQDKHQLQQWVYETSNSVMPFSERSQKSDWENGKQP